MTSQRRIYLTRRTIVAELGVDRAWAFMQRWAGRRVPKLPVREPRNEQIRAALSAGADIEDVARQFGLHPRTVERIDKR